MESSLYHRPTCFLFLHESAELHGTLMDPKPLTFAELGTVTFDSIITINGRGNYTAPCVMVLMWANPLRGPL